MLDVEMVPSWYDLYNFRPIVFRNVNIKGKFGFIEIEDEGDAEDAIKDLDGKSFNGGRWGIPKVYAFGSYGQGAPVQDSPLIHRKTRCPFVHD